MNYGELRKKILNSISVVLLDELEHLKKLEEKGEITSEQCEDAGLERKFEYQEWKDDLLLTEDSKLLEHFKYILERAEKIVTPPTNCLA